MKKRTTILTALTLTGILFTGCAAGTTQISRIDLDAAKAAAIEAAGFSEADVTFVSAELDRRNGIEFYDIDFHADGKEYDYDIDAFTGTVIGSETPERADKDDKALPVKAAEVPVEELTLKLEESASVKEAPEKTAPSKSETSAKISEAEAKKIALAQVPGAKESDIRGFEIDYDDGRLEYEGSIYFEEMEYEFEIDGYSGAIRSWEVESIYD
jgi:uncharacterized membrane protein YkoI